jgi:hypothetical protein
MEGKHARDLDPGFVEQVVAAKPESERIDVVDDVRPERLDRVEEAVVRQTDPVLGVEGKREARQLHDGNRAGAAALGLRAQDHDLVVAADQLLDQVQRPVHDAVHLRQEYLGHDGDTHNASR